MNQEIEIIGVTPKAIEKHLARLKAEGFRINLDEPLKKVNFGCAGIGDCSIFAEILNTI